MSFGVRPSADQLTGSASARNCSVSFSSRSSRRVYWSSRISVLPGHGQDRARARAPCRRAPTRTPDRTRCARGARSEEHTSELQSLMRTSYAVFCLKKKNKEKDKKYDDQESKQYQVMIDARQ